MPKTIGTFSLLCLLLIQFPARAEQFNALLFTKTAGFHHQSINQGVDAILQLAQRHHFHVDWQEDAAVFTDERLQKYDVLIFLSTTGDILNTQQQAAMRRFIQAGKGFVGIHSASDTEHDWPWYQQLVGHHFVSHPAIQTAKLRVRTREFPGMERMPDSFWWTDEWYEFSDAHTQGMNYILSVEEDTYERGNQRGEQVTIEGEGSFHPIAWYHQFDGGRAFYTALGHVPETFNDGLFLEHIYGGVMWTALGKGLEP